MKKLFIIINDIHIKWDNTELVKETFNQALDYCIDNDVKNIIVAGDVFTSQISQRLDTLKTWKYITELLYKNDIILHIIPGNHDKTLKDSDDSFLDIYKNDKINLYKKPESTIINGMDISFLPYYNQDKYVEELKKMKSSSVLISHQGICGSINNDNSVVSNGIKTSYFSKFKKVFLGHYHNTQEVSKTIIHCPSLYQNNYGEDINKGFTVIYEDLSYEIINTTFPQYITKIVDLEKVSKKEIKELSQIDTKDSHIKLKFKGSETKTKSIDKNYYYSLGFDIDIKNNLIEDNIDSTEEFVEYDEELIKEHFKEFCEENSLEEKEGFEILNKIFE